MVPLSLASGWLAASLVLSAGGVPVIHRVLFHRRAATDSPPMRAHVVLGLVTATFALGHTLTVLPSLGSPAAVGGGSAALAPGAIAFFLLFAHVGLGLQLRAPRLRDRAKKRRLHGVFAASIVALAAAHVIALRAYAGGGSG
jgi:cytochrome b561